VAEIFIFRKRSYMDNSAIINEVKKAVEAIKRYTAHPRLDELLQCYSDSKDFLAFSSDGKVRNHEEFRKICTEYYETVLNQQIETRMEFFNVLAPELVIYSWSGDINAIFMNGNIMKLKNYGVTFVFRKSDNEWKIIHSHESSLPPEVIATARRKTK
jgi:hypothetical protein